MSEQKRHTDIDHQGAIKVQEVSTLPTPDSTQTRKIVFHTTDSFFYVCDGIAWHQLAQSGGGSGAGSAPVGSILPFSGSSSQVPNGSFLCYGQSLSTTEYSELFGVIGYTYGGSGSSFNLPDLRGRTAVGKDDMGGVSADRITAPWADNLGNAGGEESHILTEAEMPSHHHSTYLGREGGLDGSGSYDPPVYEPSATWVDTDDKGGDSPHNNIQPSITLNYIIIAVSGSGSGISHNSTENIQGGGENDYVHLSTAEYNNIPSYLSANNMFMARDEKPQGTSAQTLAIGENIRELNTVVVNTIEDVEMESSRISLPPGKYLLFAKTKIRIDPGTGTSSDKVVINWFNENAATVVDYDSRKLFEYFSEPAMDAWVNMTAVFDVTEQTAFLLRLYSNYAVWGGYPVDASGYNERYSEVIIFKTGNV